MGLSNYMRVTNSIMPYILEIAVFIFMAIASVCLNAVHVFAIENTRDNVLHRSASHKSIHYIRESKSKFSPYEIKLSPYKLASIEASANKKALRIMEQINKKYSRFKKRVSSSIKMPTCDREALFVDKRVLTSALMDRQIDILLYNFASYEQRSIAEYLPSGRYAVYPSKASVGSELARLYGVKCLPVRIIHTNKGLMYRYGKLAFRALDSQDTKYIKLSEFISNMRLMYTKNR